MKHLKTFEELSIKYDTGKRIQQTYLPWDEPEIIDVTNIPTDIKGDSVMYRGVGEKEVDVILNGGKSGTFWRGEPKEYRNYGEYLLITPIPKECCKITSKGNIEENGVYNDSFNIVDYTVSRSDTLIIIDKNTSKVIFKHFK